MKKLIILCVFTTSFFASHGQETRQRSTTLGFNAAASAHMLGWASEYFLYMDKGAPTGFGGGFRLGYGVTQLIEPYVGFDATSMGVGDVDAQSFSMTHIDLGVRFNLGGTILPVRPFLEGGFTSRKGKITQVINGASHDDVEFSGGTPHLGGGVSYFPSKAISVFARGLFTIGKSSNLTLNGSKQSDKPDVTTFRVGIGLNVNISELSGK